MAATPLAPDFDDDRTPDPRARVSFIAEMGFHCAFDNDVIVGRSDAPAAALLVPGSDVVRPSVLLTLSDVLIGSLANESVLPRITMTADLNVRALRPLAADRPFTGEARVLKSGRTTTFGEATFRSDGETEPAVLSHGTFIASPRPQDTGFSLRAGGPLARPPGTMTVPFARRVGCRRVEPGLAEIARRDDLLNPADTLQGGLVALVAEEAACSLRDGAVPTALDVRYLSAIRVGPARATAVDLGAATRVEVRDAGADGRLAAIAVVHFDS